MQNIDSFIGKARKERLQPQDTDTYARYDLKKASQARVLTKYCNEIGFDSDDYILIAFIHYINGSIKVMNNVQVFRCRERIQPSRWYYKVTEKLPKQIKFTEKYKDPELILYKPSEAHMRLKKLLMDFGIEKVSEDYDIHIETLKNLIYLRKRRTDGKHVFKTMPSFDVIRKLKDVIHPDLWYIFPEEL